MSHGQWQLYMYLFLHDPLFRTLVVFRVLAGRNLRHASGKKQAGCNQSRKTRRRTFGGVSLWGFPFCFPSNWHIACTYMHAYAVRPNRGTPETGGFSFWLPSIKLKRAPSRKATSMWYVCFGPAPGARCRCRLRKRPGLELKILHCGVACSTRFKGLAFHWQPGVPERPLQYKWKAFQAINSPQGYHRSSGPSLPQPCWNPFWEALESENTEAGDSLSWPICFLPRETTGSRHATLSLALDVRLTPGFGPHPSFGFLSASAFGASPPPSGPANMILARPRFPASGRKRELGA